jgi:hypothetical protein
VIPGALFLCLLLASLVPAEGNFYLKDGDRVVFYGDSISEQRLYPTFAETYVVTRFPQLAEGLNLAELPTPIVRQSQAVHDLTVKHNNIHATRRRELQVALAQQ